MTALSLALFFAQSDLRTHTFTYLADRTLKSASVAGTFNGWNKDAAPMKAGADGKTWTTTLPLKTGKYTYKFVLDGENWITDPKAARNEDDGNGNMNSVLVIFPTDYSAPAKIGDGKITEGAIRHSSRIPDLNVDQGKLSLTLTVRPGDVESISLIAGSRSIPMRKMFSDEIEETWRGEMPYVASQGTIYSFRIKDGAKSWNWGPKGAAGVGDNRFALKPGEFKPYIVPTWVEGTVFYQIFPDRFANGSGANDPKELAPWTAEPLYYNRFGGDAAGVSQHLGYLKGLGINAIYFNPVMRAPSNHRYDPVDFYQIDPEFGTNKEFTNLTVELNKAGIKTVVDQIFDHVGTTFAPFVDLLKNQEQSAYKDWFFVKSYPVSVKQNPPYESWWNAESMPKINLRNKGAYDYLMKSVDFWHKEIALAGWRLDVANEPPDFFWKDLRKRVKGINPQAWIVGEVWGDARHWLDGSMWDASMNYPFRDALLRHIAEGKTKPSQFMASLMTVYGWYVPQVSRNQLNLISSHDTPRFLTLCNGDRRLAKLAAGVQFAWAGSPSIYYGEEIGMEGGVDPQNRRPMRWDLANDSNDMLVLYKKLIRARVSTDVLHTGAPVPLLADDARNVTAFARVSGTESAVFVMNRSEVEQRVSISLSTLPKATVFQDLIDGGTLKATSKLDLNLPPLSFKLFASKATTPYSKESP